MRISTLERDLLRESERDPGPSPYEPVGVTPNAPPPRGYIDPDRAKGWIRRAMPIVLAHRWLFGTSLFFAFISLAAQVAIPRVLGSGIDAVISQTDPLIPDRRLAPIVILLLVLGVVRAVLTFVYRFGLYKVAYAIEFDLRSIMFEHLSRMSFSFYDKQQTGQLISRANSDIRSVQMLLAFAPFMAMTLITFFAGFAIMVTIHVGLTLVAISVLPGVYYLGVRMRNVMFPVSWIVQGRQAEVATAVEENVAGVRVVKSFAAEEQEIRKLARAAQRLRWASITTIDNQAKYAPVMENLPRLGMAFVLLYGGWLAIDGQVTIGDIVVFNQYVIMLQAPFRMLGMFLMMSQRAAASAQRIFEILDSESEIVDRPGAVDLVDARGEITFDHVRFGYGDGPDILTDLSFSVRPGETVAIVGRTGSGKSTITRLLDRFYDVRDGAVRIDGTDVRDLTLTSLRHHIAMVSEEPFLFSATVRDNIAYGRPDAPIEDVMAAARAANAHEFIAQLEDGYDSIVGERGYTLSGGQRQRIAIARALLADPTILVLDDATSAIDVRIESEIHAALHELMVERTTIVVAHRLSTISLADRVVLLEGGRVVAEGTHNGLMATEPRYVAVLATVEDGDGGDGVLVEDGLPAGVPGGGG
ncbi:MAG TPA: ABC transporter ATP-binding protein [Acidimicrobiales bacterium]|nr:ABC transporter ATP-binding protein [Acidimicrobiales bacterium]